MSVGTFISAEWHSSSSSTALAASAPINMVPPLLEKTVLSISDDTAFLRVAQQLKEASCCKLLHACLQVGGSRETYHQSYQHRHKQPVYAALELFKQMLQHWHQLSNKQRPCDLYIKCLRQFQNDTIIHSLPRSLTSATLLLLLASVTIMSPPAGDRALHAPIDYCGQMING